MLMWASAITPSRAAWLSARASQCNENTPPLLIHSTTYVTNEKPTHNLSSPSCEKADFMTLTCKEFWSRSGSVYLSIRSREWYRNSQSTAGVSTTKRKEERCSWKVAYRQCWWSYRITSFPPTESKQTIPRSKWSRSVLKAAGLAFQRSMFALERHSSPSVWLWKKQRPNL